VGAPPSKCRPVKGREAQTINYISEQSVENKPIDRTYELSGRHPMRKQRKKNRVGCGGHS